MQQPTAVSPGLEQRRPLHHCPRVRPRRACFIVKQRYGVMSHEQLAHFYVNSFLEALEVLETTPPDWKHCAIYVVLDRDASAEVVVEAHSVGSNGFIYRLASGEVLLESTQAADSSARLCTGSKVYG